MPVVTCPKCSTRLKVADGVKGNTKCPKCATVFAISAPAAPAFEVVDDEPPPPKKPAAKTPVKAEADEPDFEVLDDKPKKRITAAVDDDDEDDDRPRKKKRRDDDDDEDDDRPRGKSKSKKSKSRSRYDDDDDDWAPAPRVSGMGPARVGMLMLSISIWIYLGTFAVVGLLVFMVWVGAVIPSGLLIVPGLLGVGNWVVALIGLGFCIAGPARSRGLAIAATSVAAIHLVLVFVIANDRDSGFFAHGTVQVVSIINRASHIKDLEKAARKNPDGAAAKELKEMMEDKEFTLDDIPLSFIQYAGGQIKGDEWSGIKKDRNNRNKMRWLDTATLMPFSDKFIAVLSYQSKIFSEYVLSLLGGLLEIARIILIVLLIGSVARAARDQDAASKATGFGVIPIAIAAGVAILLTLAVYAIHDSNAGDAKKEGEKMAERLKNIKPEDWEKEMEKIRDEQDSRERGRKSLICIADLFIILLHGGVLFFPALIALQAASSARRRMR